jgi:AAA family ATP:ADP antiporter
VPILTGSLMILLFFFPTLWIIVFVMIVMRAMNYGFNVPLREMLYIPTVKDIKFKSKAWTDSIGKNVSKVSGAGINHAMLGGSLESIIAKGTLFSVVIVAGWTAASYFVARRYNKTIKEGTVIGEDPQ